MRLQERSPESFEMDKKNASGAVIAIQRKTSIPLLYLAATSFVRTRLQTHETLLVCPPSKLVFILDQHAT